MNIHLTSDLLQSWEGQIRWRLAALDGVELERGEQSVIAAPLQDVLVAELNFTARLAHEDLRRVVYIVELWGNPIPGGSTGLQDLIARCVIPFVPNKHLALADPALTAQIELTGLHQLEIQVRAQSLARFVELEFTGADVVFSDNYFDLPAGDEVKITCALPEGWTLAQAQASLRIRSLSESY